MKGIKFGGRGAIKREKVRTKAVLNHPIGTDAPTELPARRPLFSWGVLYQISIRDTNTSPFLQSALIVGIIMRANISQTRQERTLSVDPTDATALYQASRSGAFHVSSLASLCLPLKDWGFRVLSCCSERDNL